MGQKPVTPALSEEGNSELRPTLLHETICPKEGKGGHMGDTTALEAFKEDSRQ